MKISIKYICRYVNAAIFIVLAIYFFLIPFFIVIYYLNDPGLKNNSIPKFAYTLHRNLSPKYEKWARQRIESESAQKLSLENVSGTEWPMFGSVFYLMATEALQEQWEKDNSLSNVAPAKYAAGAIKASTELINDPCQAGWVRKHWGDDYLHRENVFYRMLLMNGCISYQKLLGDNKYEAALSEQAESFAKELDNSPYGLLDDYPSQCYPTDVVAALAAIKRADSVLGSDHSEFLNRSIRGFNREMADWTGLPPYEADADNGLIGNARGCSSQWITVWAPDLWPDDAKRWYDSFEKYFWQQRFGACGFREFTSKEKNLDWHFDVDSGPVVAGFGASACAFGIGAARANGRFDHAYPLSAEIIALSWPLPNGTLLIPRILSNKSEAPFLGEAGELFNFTRMPAQGAAITTAGNLPVIVYFILAGYLLAGLVVILSSVLTLRKHLKQGDKTFIPFEKIQFSIWAMLIIAGVVFLIVHKPAIGVLVLLLMQFLPRSFRKKNQQQLF